MKAPSAILTLTALCALPVLGAPAVVHRDPYIPVGTLSVDRTWVRTDLRPILSWEVRYPQMIDDHVEITSSSRIVSKQCTEMEVRVLGTAFQAGSNHPPLAVQSKVGTGTWNTLFLGNDGAAKPDQIVSGRIVEAAPLPSL